MLRVDGLTNKDDLLLWERETHLLNQEKHPGYMNTDNGSVRAWAGGRKWDRGGQWGKVGTYSFNNKELCKNKTKHPGLGSGN